MNDNRKTKGQLIQELEDLRRRVSELEKSETERKRMEETFWAIEERHRTILQSSMDGFWMVDSQGRLLEVNETYCRMSGYSVQELLTMHISDLDVKETTDDMIGHIRRVMAQGEERFESRHRRKDGTLFDVEVSVQYRPTNNGLFVGFLRDITKRKQAEEVLREREERFRLAIQATKDGLWEWNILTNQEFFSPRWCEIVGYSFDDPELPHMYNSWAERIHPNDYERVMAALTDHLEKGSPYDVEYRHRHKSGEYRWQRSSGQAVFDESGRPTRMVGAISDITRRKQTEEELRQRNLELQQLNETLEQRVRERTKELATANEALHHLSTQLLSAQEDERKRIAGEIHNTIGTRLLKIKYTVEAVQQQIGSIANIKSVPLNAIFPVIQEGMNEIRRMQDGLRPPMLDDLGLLPTLSWYFRRFQAIYSEIRIEQEIEIKERDVLPPVKIIAFRVTQEAMKNIAKHSQANLVHFFLRKLDDSIELILKDNGQGFNLEKVTTPENARKGFGLLTMKEWIELSGGSFSIKSAKGNGTVIRAVWPV